jgi:fibronectin-binding autotransporter adhesin
MRFDFLLVSLWNPVIWQQEEQSYVVFGGTMKHRIDRSRIAGRLAAALLMSTCVTPSALWAADFTVTNNADIGAGSLRQAIINSNSAGGANNIIINSGVGTITLTSADLPPVANNATIVGNGNTLSGGNTFRGLFIGG